MNSIYVLALISLIGVAAAYDGADKLCRLEKDAPEVTTTDELMEVFSALKTGKNLNCAEDVVNAITRLENLEYSDVCSERAIDNFYRHWSKFGAKSARFAADLPVQLRKFLQAYGLQVSKLCKTALVDNLEKVTEEKGITDEDFRVVTQDIKEDGLIIAHLGHEPRIAEVPMHAYPASFFPKSKQYLSPKHHKYYEIVHELCVKKLDPIWMRLIAPVARLAKMGFNYKEDSLDARVHELIKKPIWWDWFHVIAQCNLMRTEIPILAAKKKVDENEQVELIKHLEEEDFIELRERLGAAYEKRFSVERVDYKTDVTLDNQVIDKNDAHMIQLIEKQGKGSFSETTKHLWKVAKRAPKVIKYRWHRKPYSFGLKEVEIVVPEN